MNSLGVGTFKTTFQLLESSVVEGSVSATFGGKYSRIVSKQGYVDSTLPRDVVDVNGEQEGVENTSMTRLSEKTVTYSHAKGLLRQKASD